MVRHAIQQMNDPLRIQLEGGHLLPEPLAAVLIRPRELGLRQLPRELVHQLTLLQVRKGQGCRPPIPGTAPSPWPSAAGRGGVRSLRADRLSHRWLQRVFQGFCSRDGEFSSHSQQTPPAPPGFAMKRISGYKGAPPPELGWDLPW